MSKLFKCDNCINVTPDLHQNYDCPDNWILVILYKDSRPEKRNILCPSCSYSLLPTSFVDEPQKPT